MKDRDSKPVVSKSIGNAERVKIRTGKPMDVINPYKEAVLRIRIRDPVPFCPSDPGWVKSGSGSGLKHPNHIYESLDTNFLG
jgi:hypothetical protein